MKGTDAISLPRRYVEFDGLRGLLALWVGLAHLFCWCGYGRLSGDGKAGKLWSIFTGADAAAQCFIILSGFAIATLLRREHVGYGRYMLRRVFRIYPVYLVALLVAMWMAPATGLIINSVSWSGDFYMDWQRTAQASQEVAWGSHAWAHVFLIQGLLPKALLDGVSVTFLMPAWSIGLEEQFYLVAPLLMWMLRRSWGLVAVLLVAMAGQIFQSWWSNPVNASLPFWLPFFLVGIGSSHVAHWVEKNQEDVSKWGRTIAFSALVAAIFLAREPLPFLIWGVACPVALGVWTGFAGPVGKLVTWVLRNRAAQLVGDISYSLYLIHWPVIIMLLGVLYRYQPSMPKHQVLMLMLAVGLPVILLLSWALHVAVEKPFMRLGRRLANPASAESKALPELPALP
ncbi:MAG: hypothetical protein JWO89_24 [Verrucomicrobiaceae bacterium]|nr:hypothetical protein [Verrucomicrobiaceae bacterium]